MKEFVLAALPWVMMGIELAILAVNYGKEKQKEGKRGAQIATGAALGLLLGVALNNCGLWENHLFGLALGPLWGIVLGELYNTEEIL